MSKFREEVSQLSSRGKGINQDSDIEQKNLSSICLSES